MCEELTFELTGYNPSGPAGRFAATDLVEPDPIAPGLLRHHFTTEVPYEATPSGPTTRRRIGWTRTLFRADDLSALLPLGQFQPLSLAGEHYRCGFTPA